jgi:NADH-quinone oxidoreductase subunit L
MEHGVLHTGNHDIDPQDMLNMGDLKSKMPRTFWTFLIGGFALSGFPVLTAGFWSKDEILADAWAHHHTVVFWTLAVAALLTALTFLGQARTKEAEHAHESANSMTVPLMILAVFAIGFGWVGIPDHFPVIGGLIPNWFHDFVAGTLAEHPHPVDFNMFPLLVSLVVALGGLTLGWLVYRKVPAGGKDPLKKVLGPVHTLLENMYYIDQLYDLIFIRPAIWISEKFTYMFMDRGVIDGFLHLVVRITYSIGGFLRNYFDIPVINEFMGDGTAAATHWFGKQFRKIQTGVVQQYMSIAMLVAFGGLIAYLIVLNR